MHCSLITRRVLSADAVGQAMTFDATRILPSAHFSTDIFDAGLRFEAWRHFLPLYTVLPHPDGLDTVFEGRIASSALGPMGFGTTTFASQRYIRSRQRIAADGQDHIIVQLLTAGGLTATTEAGRQVVVRTGDIWVHDLGRPKTVTTEASRTISILLPRSELLRVVGAGDLDGHVLPRGSPTGTLLGQHLRTLARIMPGLTTDEAPAIAFGTMALAASCLRPGLRLAEAAREPATAMLLERVRNHIDAHLASSALTPEALCAVFRVSRANLYRMFAPHGGVAGYIRQRRLERAETLLRNPANARRTIADIAFECGFGNEAHFSRAFRTAFGLAPRELRGSGVRLMLDETILQQWEAALLRL